MPGLELVVGDAAVPLAHRDAQLAPREMRAEAAVHTAAEREVAVARAVEPHLERVGELGFVDVGRSEVHRDERSRAAPGNR